MKMDKSGIGNSTMYYVTDWPVSPGYYQYDKHRFPQGYIELMPWFTLNWRDVESQITGTNNIIFFNTPVGDELQKLQIVQKYVNQNKVFVIQEGCFWDWFEWPAAEQELYIKILSECTAFVCSEDVKKEASIFAKNLVHNRICTNTIATNPREKAGDYVFLINPIKRYQRGMIAHKIVHDSVPSSVPIVSMKYNRPTQFNELLSFPDSYKMPGFLQSNYLDPNNWLSAIYGAKFGIDITRDFAGGNSVLEFASMGIPLVGNQQLQPQQDIFPDTSFDYFDVDGIKKAIHLLLNDNEFYKEVSEKAYSRVKEHWNSEVVVSEFKQRIKPFTN